MLRKPPHVLVTTPESLFILLTAEKSRALLTGVETIVMSTRSTPWRPTSAARTSP